MPAGVSWGEYLRFCTAASITMFLGAQVVHTYYKPLQDVEILVAEKLEERKRPGESEKANKNT